MSLMHKKQAQDRAAAGRHPLEHILRSLKPAFVSEQGDDWMWIDEIVQPILKNNGRRMWDSRNLPNDYFDSENQRDRAFARNVTFYESIHNIPILVRPDGRFYVYYRDPDTGKRHTYTMHHKAAYTSEGAERRLVVTQTGLAVLNERGELIPAAKGTTGTEDFMDHRNLANKKNGLVLEQAWKHAQQAVGIAVAGSGRPSQTATAVDDAVGMEVDASVAVSVGGAVAAVDAAETGSSRTTTACDESEQGYGSDTTVHSLALRLYNDIEATATQNLATTGRNPSSYRYTLPVHISDAVVPLKRFLDDCYPNGGRMFLINPMLQLPPKYSQYVIWDSLLRHISQKSRRHPHYDYWRGIASGTSSLVPFAKHLAKLRPITFKGKRNVEVTDANGRPKRTKGTLLIFGSPLENAGKGSFCTLEILGLV
ncbi:hypothetical protein NQZ79_g7575 [Umbelopsis isabellina]|nr:hypothetical protein NQZ79_g7575 [Umbelopsis isabellina]